MRALVVGAVESTQVAIAALAASPDWQVAAVMSLPPELAHRHSDFVDLAPYAAAAGARMIHAANGNAPEAVAAVREVDADLAFVIGWSQICRAPFIDAAGGRLVGYHPAPLPRLRGRAVLPWTILQAEPITAASLFWIEAEEQGVDSGPIIAQHYFHVPPDEDATGLYANHMTALRQALDSVLPLLARGRAPAVPQDERCATWAARRTADDGCIDWRQPAHAVARLVRAVTRPYPGAFTSCREGKLTLWRAAEDPAGLRHLAAPGQVIALSDTGFTVMCGDGRALRVLEHDGPRPRMHEILGA